MAWQAPISNSDMSQFQLLADCPTSKLANPLNKLLGNYHPASLNHVRQLPVSQACLGQQWLVDIRAFEGELQGLSHEDLQSMLETLSAAMDASQAAVQTVEREEPGEQECIPEGEDFHSHEG